MKIRLFGQKLFLYLFLSLLAGVFLMPFLYTVYTSLLANEHVDTIVRVEQLTMEVYKFIFTDQDLLIGRWYVNSIIVTTGIVLGNLIVNTLAGYALAKFSFPGKKLIFFFIIGMMMVPYQICLIPTYVLLVKLGWINSYFGLIVPFLFQGFLTFLMRQFFITLPDELNEAAEIDGLSKAGTFLHIMLPLAKAGIATQVIFSFTGTWNAFVWPVTIVNDRNLYTLTVGMNTLKNIYFSWPNRTMAGVVLITLPIIVIFMIFQRYFVEGVAASGIKG